MEGYLMENCPNCQNQICVNPSFTQTLNFLDLVTESNSFEMETNEDGWFYFFNYGTMDYDELLTSVMMTES